jgi:hypothetical protein
MGSTGRSPVGKRPVMSTTSASSTVIHGAESSPPPTAIGLHVGPQSEPVRVIAHSIDGLAPDSADQADERGAVGEPDP